MKYWNSLVVVVFFGFGLTIYADPIADMSAASAADGQQHLFYAEDIKLAVSEHITDQLDETGIFHITDGQTGEQLQLRFVQVHDPVRQIGSGIYFACTDFHVEGNPKKIYDIDFWLEPLSIDLKVYDTKIHKEPKWSLIYGWYKHPRYTFVNDEIEYLY
ncbi:MAG: hypothetical protein HOL98_08995 [Gammaproteobacteria bacterium]|jgi:hypothetical protein|nr:hypothetical protein [Gammaproteobacteria bacterium]MBT5203578.1 hypothetical protein [Gammaproteobacteria bacterium]MBT5601141.1 hypothetical protein [Gammaproteobacteria bacterium]MBT6246969.1 hypothetical protein [Gammaproteobacteria bacterium]